jgi:hypothetical protein
MDLPIINSIQRRRFFLADPFHLSVMQNFTLITMVLQHHKDSAADCCKLAWTMQDMPKKVKRNAIFGFIVHLSLGVILQTFINTNIRSAG